MLEFSLPVSQSVDNVSDISGFFKRERPHQMTQTMLTSLRRLPFPSASVVEKLVELRPRARLDGY
jgi:hypothetical protein